MRKVPGFHGFNRADPWICLGTRKGIRFAKTKPGALIAPLDLDPMSVQWPVQDLTLIVVAQEDKATQVQSLLEALARDGAQVVIVLGDKGEMAHYKRGETR
jgi:hypothetical protein